MSSSTYDFIFTGAGAAALSLAVRIKHSPALRNKRILLIDRSLKNQNDRTWSFWEKGDGFFDSIIYKSWDHLSFHSDGLSLSLDMSPYRYKMIRGIDFYNHCRESLQRYPDVHFMQANVQWVGQEQNTYSLLVDGKPFDTSEAIVFNSIFDDKLRNKHEIYLLQHFMGWVVETEEPAFDPDRATLMDFTVAQTHGTTFAYVLPFSDRVALIEYTLFTAQLLSDEAYEQGLQKYMDGYLQGRQYRVVEKEFGIIPMTDRRFSFYKGGIYHIGTSGGQTKASTGYTFQFIQKQSQEIVSALEQHSSLQELSFSSSRFRFYDGILLSLLAKGRPSGKAIFTRLFSRNRAAVIFRFLDNETTLFQELQLISRLPFFPFFKAALRRIVRF